MACFLHEALDSFESLKFRAGGLCPRIQGLGAFSKVGCTVKVAADACAVWLHIFSIEINIKYF